MPEPVVAVAAEVVVLPNEERTVENPILNWLQSAELGWRYEDAKAVAREYRARRADGTVDERDNQEWLKWLRNEKTMKFAVDEPEQNIRLIDYEKAGTPDDKNDYLATNQFRVEGPKDNIRTDILLFVNGILLVDIEAKTTGRDWHVDWTEGAKQCARYGREAPQLYYSNIFCGGVNEFVFRYGVPGTKFHTWHEWRAPWPHTHIPGCATTTCCKPSRE
jgi:type I restriction enzyme R subunit